MTEKEFRVDSVILPTAENERNLTLDILRAVALFGVFLMNVQFFTRPIETVPLGIEPGLHGVNYALAWFEDVFMLGKFWTIFSLLFGMGFAVMTERMARKGTGFLAPYLRRTMVLLVFGVAHAVLIWGGDVLHRYAMAAGLLLLILHGRWWWLLLPAPIFLVQLVLGGSPRLNFAGMIFSILLAGMAAFLGRDAIPTISNARRVLVRRVLPVGLVVLALTFAALWVGSGSFVHAAGLVSFSLLAIASLVLRGDPPSHLWRAGSVLYAILPLAIAAVTFLMRLTADISAPGAQAANAKSAAKLQAAIDSTSAIHADGSYAENVAYRLSHLLDGVVSTGVYELPGIVGMFLIGVWCIRSGVMREPRAHRRLFAQWVRYGLPIGIALALISSAISTAYDSAHRDAFTIASNLMAIANLPLSLAYLGLLVLWIHRDRNPGLLWLAPVGRMALSNYLLQSLVGTLFFYGYGLAMWGRVDRVGQLVLVCGVFAVQIGLSRWWLMRFHFGPVEWLWRALTYLQWPPLVRQVGSSFGRTRDHRNAKTDAVRP